MITKLGLLLRSRQFKFLTIHLLLVPACVQLHCSLIRLITVLLNDSISFIIFVPKLPNWSELHCWTLSRCWSSIQWPRLDQENWAKIYTSSNTKRRRSEEENWLKLGFDWMTFLSTVHSLLDVIRSRWYCTAKICCDDSQVRGSVPRFFFSVKKKLSTEEFF